MLSPFGAPRPPSPADAAGWGVYEIKDWFQQKDTANALCGARSVSSAHQDCSRCQKIHLDLLREALARRR